MTGQTIYSEKCVTSVITVTILRKDLMFMRSKTLGINVRVTPAEKEKLSENAYYCGLSLSEYAHLDYSSKLSSAQAMVSGMPLPEAGDFGSRWEQNAEKSGE